MESNRDGIVIDPITFGGNNDAQSGGDGGVLRIEWITVSFTPKTFGIEKSIIVFEFTSANDDDDDDSEDYYGSTIATGSVKQFTITRYITIRSGEYQGKDSHPSPSSCQTLPSASATRT
eukprot:scaffold18754_cov155-Skeletonema_dohrnii-CCMP3373.AAC.2